MNFSQLYRAKNDAVQCDVYLRKAVRIPNMDMYKFRNEEMAELEKYILSAKGKKPKKSNILLPQVLLTLRNKLL